MNDMKVLGGSIAILLVAAPSAVAQGRPTPWYERGPSLHFAASAELATNGYTLGAAFSDDKRVRLASGAALALAAGFAKELYDLSANGDFSWSDIGWGVVGTATGLLISWLVDRLLFGPSHRTLADRLGLSVAPAPHGLRAGTRESYGAGR
jgi:putative lipoprotein